METRNLLVFVYTLLYDSFLILDFVRIFVGMGILGVSMALILIMDDVRHPYVVFIKVV